jgi:hypothetical protein
MQRTGERDRHVESVAECPLRPTIDQFSMFKVLHPEAFMLWAEQKKQEQSGVSV